jgi:hypothetical protein
LLVDWIQLEETVAFQPLVKTLFNMVREWHPVSTDAIEGSKFVVSCVTVVGCVTRHFDNHDFCCLQEIWSAISDNWRGLPVENH